ncbi:MAG: response regulator [Candidatus Daviesbacteria bacterium]|nr:response regulator [Candidatus Daviesbacteria bacterium]
MAKVLLVEDEPSIRDLYSRQLTKAGHEVIAVEDGTKGLEQLKTAQFDILLLDIMLPGLNGLQVLKEFKTINPQSPTKVILLTNLGQDSVIKEGFDLGANAYLIKASYTPDQVVTEVQNILTNQPSSLPNTAPTT